jgi:hypothetical protein
MPVHPCCSILHGPQQCTAIDETELSDNRMIAGCECSISGGLRSCAAIADELVTRLALVATYCSRYVSSSHGSIMHRGNAAMIACAVLVSAGPLRALLTWDRMVQQEGIAHDIIRI